MTKIFFEFEKKFNDDLKKFRQLMIDHGMDCELGPESVDNSDAAKLKKLVGDLNAQIDRRDHDWHAERAKFKARLNAERKRGDMWEDKYNSEVGYNAVLKNQLEAEKSAHAETRELVSQLKTDLALAEEAEARAPQPGV